MSVDEPVSVEETVRLEESASAEEPSSEGEAPATGGEGDPTEAPGDDDVGAPQPVAMAPLRFCPLELERVEVLLPAQHARMVLRELDGERRYLTIPIGLPEASAIVVAKERLETPRPLTHELFARTVTRLGGMVECVRITAGNETSFVAELVLSGPRGSVVIDCRPSDGVALALRQELTAPITVIEEVLDQLGTATAS